MLHKNTVVASWQIFEYENTSRTKDWYWIVVFVALVTIVLAIILKNYLFAFLVLISTGLIVIYSIRQPQSVEVEVSTNGINVAHVEYPYDTISAFWITETLLPTTQQQDTDTASGSVVVHHLLLATDRMYHPFVKVQLPSDMNPFAIREFLLQFLPERQITEPFGYKIIERLGF